MRLSLSGGASRGLNYLSLMKEIQNKNIKFDAISGASAGAIFSGIISNGYTAEEAAAILESIGGDWVMKLFCEAENTKGFKQIMSGLAGVLFRNIPGRSIQRIMRKKLSWQKAYCNVSTTVVDERDVIKFLGKEVIQSIFKTTQGSQVRLLEALSNYKVCDILAAVPVYCFSRNGVKKYTFDNGKYLTPDMHVNKNTLADCVLGSFANPILPPVWLTFGSYKFKAFDGGMVDNFASLEYFSSDKFVVACNRIGKDITKPNIFMAKGFGNTNLYTLNVPDQMGIEKVKSCASNVEYKGFFGFYKANIEEYMKLPATSLL